MTEKIKIAAYCRVSTDKEDQLASLAAQKSFFEEYAKLHHYELYQLYADEGISGTKLKNRPAFHQMMEDARNGHFQQVFVKDISRFSRNAVDFLTSIRELKRMGIKCDFVNANLSTEDGEFTLGILALVAQEESSNLSKRVKFGKSKNAQKGKVPNLVYGYDKTIGELFDLKINEKEAKIVQRIYHLYLKEGYGTMRIAQQLNEEGMKTKRQCKWSQNAVSRILTNPIYTGKIINGKEEIQDFLTGSRRKNPPEHWYIQDNPRLSIISLADFEETQKLVAARQIAYKTKKQKIHNKYALSTLIQCSECGYSFRRIYKTRQNGAYIKWSCSNRNANGKNACQNRTILDEEQLLSSIQNYFIQQLQLQNPLIQEKFNKAVALEVDKLLKKTKGYQSLKDIENQLTKLQRTKEKQLEMYEGDAITLDELKQRTTELNHEIAAQEALLAKHASGFTPENYANLIQDSILYTNHSLRQLIDRIIVNAEGEVSVYIKK